LPDKTGLDLDQGGDPCRPPFSVRPCGRLLGMPIDKITALSQIAAFSRLPHALIEQLASVAGIQRIGKGSALFREGEHADFVYALVKGGVSLICGPNSAKTVADFIAAGDLILVPPALLDLPYMVTAQAVTDLLVVMIPTPEFRRLAETELPLAVALNHLLAGHWRFLLRHLTHTKSRDADARLVQFLIDSADVTSGTVHLALPGSKRNLAAHL